MFFLKMAFKNLTRHKRRTLITALIIAFAILIYIMTEGLMIGMTEMSFNNIINLESGHLQVAKKSYWEDRKELPLDNLISPTEELENKIEKTTGFKAMTKRLNFSVRLNNGIDELPVTGVGIDLGQDRKVFRLNKYLVKGRMPREGSSEIIMGTKLAELMGFKNGDYAILLFRTDEDTFNTIDGEIVGLFNTPHPSLNESSVFLPLSTAQSRLNVEDKISHYAIRLTEQDQAIPAAEELNSRLKDPYHAYSWKDAAQSLVTMLEMQEIETQVILAIILTLAAVGIINTVILSALERMEELGMMKALGMHEREIVYTFMLEAAGIGIIGGSMGIIMGVIGLAIFNINGIDMSALTAGGDMTYGFPLKGTIYAGWELNSFIFVFLYGVFISILASVFPALWAARKDPVKAIYHR
ncbi:putative ABC transport system permease protein [Halanaerobium saccharolyticum]|uniref:Putative ABC transport system permease protein n=1 Tax=Halanaerobium saccharolyticum TaxID=43595 RepID=A0A4R6LS19_9FIRM|nr:FtsX-like permease family protein [Halanaerobium saccharolyticum]TDO91315.1 putative ABC transport system permease protein [Halanaerobium saccharolyticum]